MKSPFPGMDPYLEAHWRDVHARLVIYLCDSLQAKLGGGLRARVEERVVIETPSQESRGIFPLQKPLPKIAIPLRQQDADVVVELQPLVDRAYANGAYDDTDYSRPCIPPLQGAEAEWAQQILKEAGRR